MFNHNSGHHVFFKGPVLCYCLGILIVHDMNIIKVAILRRPVNTKSLTGLLRLLISMGVSVSLILLQN